MKPNSDELDHMHDIIYEAFGYKPTDDEILEYWELLPSPIQGVAELWGFGDTVFRDQMYEFLIKNEENVKGR